MNSGALGVFTEEVIMRLLNAALVVLLTVTGAFASQSAVAGGRGDVVVVGGGRAFVGGGRVFVGDGHFVRTGGSRVDVGVGVGVRVWGGGTGRGGGKGW